MLDEETRVHALLPLGLCTLELGDVGRRLLTLVRQPIHLVLEVGVARDARHQLGVELLRLLGHKLELRTQRRD